MQCTFLKEKLENDWYHSVLIKSLWDKLHYACVWYDWLDQYYLDPFLRQSQPISLTKLFKNKKDIIVDTLPTIDSISNHLTSYIIARYIDKHHFSIALVSRYQDSERVVHDYLYNACEKIITMSNITSEEFLIKKRKSLMSLLVGKKIYDIAIDNDSYFMEIKDVLRETKINQRTNPVGFSKRTEEIAKRLWTNWYDLLMLFYQWAWLQNTHQ